MDFNKQIVDLEGQIRNAISNEIGEHKGIYFIDGVWSIGAFNDANFCIQELWVSKIIKSSNNKLLIYAVNDVYSEEDADIVEDLDIESLANLEDLISNNVNYTFID